MHVLFACACWHVPVCMCMFARACLRVHVCTCMFACACLHVHVCMCMFARAHLHRDRSGCAICWQAGWSLLTMTFCQVHVHFAAALTGTLQYTTGRATLSTSKRLAARPTMPQAAPASDAAGPDEGGVGVVPLGTAPADLDGPAAAQELHRGADRTGGHPHPLRAPRFWFCLLVALMDINASSEPHDQAHPRPKRRGVGTGG